MKESIQKVFVVVDSSYIMNIPENDPGKTTRMRNFISKLVGTKPELGIVTSDFNISSSKKTRDVLSFVDAKPCDAMVSVSFMNNVYPAPLVIPGKKDSMEGRPAPWAMFVRWRKQADYIWIPPDRERCWERGEGDNNDIGPETPRRLFESYADWKEKSNPLYHWNGYFIRKALPSLNLVAGFVLRISGIGKNGTISDYPVKRVLGSVVEMEIRNAIETGRVEVV